VRRAAPLAVLTAGAIVLAGCGSASDSATTTAGVTTAVVTTAVEAPQQHAARHARRASAARADTGQLALITEPPAGIAPLLDAIRGARRSVEVVMYEDEDAQIDAALASAHARGVKVQVLLNGGYYGEGSSENEPAYRYLRAHGVAARWTAPYFALTHQKSLVVDGRAYILTFNLTPLYYSADRDFGIVDRDTADVSAIERTFAADWARRRIAAPAGRDLIWSPGSQQALIALIGSARGYVDVYNEEMDSAPVEQALADAARRGVDVRVTMTYDSAWRDAFEALTSAGVRVRTYASNAPLYIHAKMILTPHRAFIGSENFSSTSLESNRELGITFTTPGLLASLHATFDRDFAQAQPFQAAAG
jgi:cardiolipin synthase